jgi:hypothetical protein
MNCHMPPAPDLRLSDQVVVQHGLVGEGVDPAGDVVVHDQRQVGGGGLQLGRDLADKLGVGREGDLIGGVGGRFFEGGRKAVALLERDEFQRVDGREQLIELVGKLRVVLQVHAAGEHGVDRGIEVLARGFQMLAVVAADAGIVAGFHLRDERLHLLGVLLRGERLLLLLRLREGSLHRGLLCDAGLCGGGGAIGGNAARRARGGVDERAAREQDQQRQAGQGQDAAVGRVASPRKGGVSPNRHQPCHCKRWAVDKRKRQGAKTAKVRQGFRATPWRLGNLAAWRRGVFFSRW